MPSRARYLRNLAQRLRKEILRRLSGWRYGKWPYTHHRHTEQCWVPPSKAQCLQRQILRRVAALDDGLETCLRKYVKTYGFKLKKKASHWLALNKTLAMTYFHMGRPHTIIGVRSFHFWVRYGIRWFQTAMVARKTVWIGLNTLKLNLNSKFILLGCARTLYVLSTHLTSVNESIHKRFSSSKVSDYMAKTISQLVQVSFTHYCASTPCLSTS